MEGLSVLKKILWFSRHPPFDFQVSILKKIFGEDMILKKLVGDQNKYMSAEKFVAYMKEHGFDETVMVAPLSVMEKVIELGIKPIKAEVIEIKDSQEATFSFNDRYYKFIKFVRVVRIELVTEDL